MNNRIKRNFTKITAVALIDTNVTKKGDTVHVYKNDLGYLALNTRTGLYFYTPVATLRNENVFRFIETV